jgi:hypothetical protein
VRAAEDAPRGPNQLLEHRNRLANIFERGTSLYMDYALAENSRGRAFCGRGGAPRLFWSQSGVRAAARREASSSWGYTKRFSRGYARRARLRAFQR